MAAERSLMIPILTPLASPIRSTTACSSVSSWKLPLVR